MDTWPRARSSSPRIVTKPAASELARKRDGLAARGLVPERDHDVDAASGDRLGEHAPLGHDDDNPLEAEREPAGRDLTAEKHADQIVVAAAAAEAARQVRHGDLHDRTGVV